MLVVVLDVVEFVVVLDDVEFDDYLIHKFEEGYYLYVKIHEHYDVVVLSLRYNEELQERHYVDNGPVQVRHF